MMTACGLFSYWLMCYWLCCAATERQL